MLPRWAIFCVYAGGASIAIFLLVQHWVHVPLALPWLIFLACPLMHLFMHRGRHHRSRDPGTPPPVK
jgi:hypothetical protein